MGIIEIKKGDEVEIIHPKDVLELQSQIADVAFTLDFPIPPNMDSTQAKERQNLTIANAHWALDNKRRRDLPLYACVQAWDLSAAQAVAAAIQQLRPRVFTLENVPRYLSSQSFTIILNTLESLGYNVNYSLVNMADYGLPQARKRLVLVACFGITLTLPPTSKLVGWYSTITSLSSANAHVIPTMPDSQLLPRQQQSLNQFLATNEPAPLLIERVGGRKLSKYKPGSLPANTILRSHFTDHKGCNRNKFADIWLLDSTVKSLSIQAAAILQGFPAWYKFPPQSATAGSIIGYSVPPSFASQLFTHIQQQLEQ
ncbi:DNA cytosine methyltransferase [Nodularia chucula]|uniref:DNA cytosine methyltransferase n=1 Tax=Nodularia chucula TaxID=3093667 RepID=UPI0039C641B4